MQPSKLKDHKLKKGRFITPFNEFATPMSDDESWVYGRLPEYLWIGLIFEYYGRSKALDKFKILIKHLHDEVAELKTLRLSEILSLKEENQNLVYSIILKYVDKRALSPLTAIFTLSKYRTFVAHFFDNQSVDERIHMLTDTLRKSMNHQSYEATDIRFVVLVYWFRQGKLHITADMMDLLNRYALVDHSAEIMKRIRPTVRSMEQMQLQLEAKNTNYICNFWDSLSQLTECDLYTVINKKEDREMKGYLEILHNILVYYIELYENAEPLNKKMKVLIGIFTYSYKRFKEAVDHELFSTISGRSIVRVITENYIMAKYLCLIEEEKSNVWEDYEMYGIGQYKLILEKRREFKTDLQNPHFDEKYVEALVNEYTNEEFIDMDTRYFDSKNIREKADKVGEKDLYGLIYDYDSAFEHGLWGAIRESSFLKCDNPAHQYHCVPDSEDSIVMKSTADDCVFVLNRTVEFLDELYGLPENMKKGALEFEKKLTVNAYSKNPDRV